MNARRTIAITLSLLLALFAALAYRGRTPILIPQPDPRERRPLRSGDELRAEMFERVRAEKVYGVETASASHGQVVFVGSLGGSSGMKHVRSLSHARSDLWLVDREGGLHRLTNDGMSYNPEWSPSGSEIAFVNQGSINIVDTATKQVRAVIDAYVADSPDERDNSYQHVVNDHPQWSPNGEAIAAVADDGSSQWVRVVSRYGRGICHFGRGITDYQWTPESALALAYGRFEFDWDHLFSTADIEEHAIYRDDPEPLDEGSVSRPHA